MDPYRAVKNAARLEGTALHAADAVLDLRSFQHILVVGAGKAASLMAAAVEDVIGDRISGGLVIVKYGHTAPLRILEQIEAAHPIPDDAGREATERVLSMARETDERSLIICLLSGGASALLVAPAAGITLRDKQQATYRLLRAGATIVELNAVRKHLSAVKGGRFAQAACRAQIITLILSDVIGDRLDAIASGPTAWDDSTYADALAVIGKYGLEQDMPSPVMDLLARGARGQEPETVKSGDACLHKTRNVIVGSITQALAAARDVARRTGYETEVLTAELQGEASEAARTLARSAIAARDTLRPGTRRCLLSGGETTVKVVGDGIGGRNQELALAFAVAIEGHSGIALLAAGTDGTDGPTDAAGALVDGSTAAKARAHGLSPEEHLAKNDAYTFFKRFDAVTGSHCHLKTGPTGTNVMDIQIVIVEGEMYS